MQPLEQLAGEELGRLGIALPLHHDVKCLTVLIHCPPRVDQVAVDLAEHLIEAPASASAMEAPRNRLAYSPPDFSVQRRVPSCETSMRRSSVSTRTSPKLRQKRK